ncbi:restriction endonuclease subunit S [Olivibacter sp. XZL3]|uniref:restriction endonuclease subunit S n=1 Tax=Olivibacter sp. XZL3 TaxID=1735116 RepID=UPI001066FCC1|nr:restriction endonuclease subunit S [Olivibacter sp. XZL3]
MWEKVQLKAIIEKPISGEWGDDGGNIKIIRTTNFTNNGILDLTDVVSRNIGLKKVQKKRLFKGDTIIEKSGGSPTQPVGRVVFFNEEAIYLCNNFTSIIRPKQNVFPKYLFWFLFNNHISKKTLKYQNKTTGIINLKLENYINEIEIPLPPLPIQEKIAAIIDKADELRRKDQELQKKYDELAQAIFIDMFGDPVKNEKGWEVKKLGEICRKITDGTHHSPKNTNEGYKYVTAKHIKNCKLDFNSNPTYVSETDHKEIVGRCNPEFQDVLYIKDGATTGMAAVNTLTEEFSMLSSLALFKLNKNFINHDYLTYYLNADFVKENLIREFMAGAAIKRFTLQKIKNFNILLPPLHLQQAFAKKIELINEVKAKTNTTKSEELFQSLLRRAFKGELVDQYSVL